jgi:hypothetical protein
MRDISTASALPVTATCKRSQKYSTVDMHLICAAAVLRRRPRGFTEMNAMRLEQAVPETKGKRRTALKALVIWIGILPLAIANGAFREAVLIPMLGNTPGFVLSGILLSVGILIVAYLTLPWIGQTSTTTYVVTGLAWLCLTLVFEFGFGLAQGKSWAQLFEAYMFRDGNIWPVVLLVTAAAPYLSAKTRGWA